MESLFALIDTFDAAGFTAPLEFSSPTSRSLGSSSSELDLVSSDELQDLSSSSGDLSPSVSTDAEPATPSPTRSPPPLPTAETAPTTVNPAAATTTSTAGSAPKQRKKRKKTNPAHSSTALQRRKRAEIKTLREQIAELEARLNLLKNVQDTGVPSKNSIAAKPSRNADTKNVVWRGNALHEYRERRRAEDINDKLRVILSSQRKVSRALESLVTAQSVLQVRLVRTACNPPPFLTASSFHPTCQLSRIWTSCSVSSQFLTARCSSTVTP